MIQPGLFNLIPEYPWLDQWLGAFPSHGDARPHPIHRIEYRSGLIVLFGRHADRRTTYHETFQSDGHWCGRSPGNTAEGDDGDVRVLYRAKRGAV